MVRRVYMRVYMRVCVHRKGMSGSYCLVWGLNMFEYGSRCRWRSRIFKHASPPPNTPIRVLPVLY